MKLPLDPRLPISDDITGIKRRLYELFKEHAIRINAVSKKVSNGDLLGNYADDTAAAAGGIDIGDFYRTGSTVKQRVT